MWPKDCGLGSVEGCVQPARPTVPQVAFLCLTHRRSGLSCPQALKAVVPKVPACPPLPPWGSSLPHCCPSAPACPQPALLLLHTNAANPASPPKMHTPTKASTGAPAAARLQEPQLVSAGASNLWVQMAHLPPLLPCCSARGSWDAASLCVSISRCGFSLPAS